MEKVLGIDLGTNSIGWALREINNSLDVTCHYSTPFIGMSSELAGFSLQVSMDLLIGQRLTLKDGSS